MSSAPLLIFLFSCVTLAIQCNNHATYQKRLKECAHPLAQRLLNIVVDKKTNIALSADVTTKKELLSLADNVGPYICMIKLHIDIIDDFDTDLIAQLEALALKHNFIILEDRKFADIGNTVNYQYHHGIYRISAWADLVTAHLVAGVGTIEGLTKDTNTTKRGILLLAQMSSKNNLLNTDYTQKIVTAAQLHRESVIGFITQEKLSDDSFLFFTPGIQLQSGGDSLGQSYITPQMALEKGSDILIIGRGIYHAADPIKAAEEYRTVSWQAYERACQPSHLLSLQ